MNSEALRELACRLYYCAKCKQRLDPKGVRVIWRGQTYHRDCYSQIQPVALKAHSKKVSA